MDNFLLYITKYLPKRFIMWCAIQLFAETTMNQYGNTDPNDLNIVESLDRFMKLHGL